MENTDLLNPGAKDKISLELRKSQNGRRGSGGQTRDPPDGGALAWSIMVGSFLTNGILFGTINSAGTVYSMLENQLKAEGYTDAYASSKASLVGSLAIGSTFFLSPVSGVLTDALGIRQTAVLGGTIAAGGMLLSSFLSHNINALCFTYGIMYGFGAALAYTPSLAILGHYFKRYIGLVNGIVTAGSPIFTILILQLLSYLKNNHDLQTIFRVQAAITFGVALCGFLFKPIHFMIAETPKREGGIKAFWKTVINVEIFKKKKYVIWVLALPSALFGYFVPYIFYSNFIKQRFPGHNENIAVQCIGATSGIGRLLVGFLSDRPKVNRILLQQISFYVIGVLTIILPFVSSFWMVIVIALGMGFFDGGFIALLGPIAVDLCGSKCAAQAIGTLLGLGSIPVSSGPPIAGLLLAATGSYTLPFVLSGIPPLVGASLMFLIRYVRVDESVDGSSKCNANGNISKYGIDEDGTQPVPLTENVA